ncbi:GtrA family protein [Lichenifustis flavocetrariae]|uniref:GtrA family protein n=1 Tax=Lichenifustis flavocetrariae TaxID=2949735 RepID=A0AA41Z1A0_9HYPH|nr:GtrA family protein [Lichenifustis flavocetrariae]MCW6508560.1 GtrA family protein [Lichenifustis flavocetrariae]
MRDRAIALIPSQFLRFALCGGFAAACNIMARILFSQVLSYQVSIVLAYLVGMMTAYLSMKVLVFETSGRAAHAETLRFCLINLAALVQVWIVSIVLADWLLPALHDTWHVETTAHIIGVLSPIVTSYAGHKYFTFSTA